MFWRKLRCSGNTAIYVEDCEPSIPKCGYKAFFFYNFHTTFP